MPGSASSQQTKGSAKARPSANVRAANLIGNTPVLFRLPALDITPDRTSTEAHVDTPVSLNTTSASAPSAVAMPMASMATASLAGTHMGAGTPGAVASMANPPLASKTDAARAPEVRDSNAPLDNETESTVTRTWWEHWSSGVVLLMLLIALATASLIAIQGAGSKANNWMADNPESVSEPVITDGDLTPVDKSHAPSLTLSLPSDSNAVKNVPADASQAQGSEESLASSGSLLDADTVVPAMPRAPELRTADAKNATAAGSGRPSEKASVSLQAPLANPSQNLLDLELPGPASSSVPASQVSTGNSDGMNSSAPNTWDSSKRDSSDELSTPTLQFNDPESLSNIGKPIGELSVPGLLTGTGTHSVTGNASAATNPNANFTGAPGDLPLPSFETEELAGSSLQDVAPPQANSGVMTTATPELDREHLLRTYLKLRQQAAGTTPANRYPQNAAPGLPNTTSNSPAAGLNVQPRFAGTAHQGASAPVSGGSASPNNGSNLGVGIPGVATTGGGQSMVNPSFTLQPNPVGAGMQSNQGPVAATANSGSGTSAVSQPTLR